MVQREAKSVAIGSLKTDCILECSPRIRPESRHTRGKTQETFQSNCELPNPPESAEKSIQVNFKTAGIQPMCSDGGSLTPKRLKTVSSPGDTSVTLGPKT